MEIISWDSWNTFLRWWQPLRRFRIALMWNLKFRWQNCSQEGNTRYTRRQMNSLDILRHILSNIHINTIHLLPSRHPTHTFISHFSSVLLDTNVLSTSTISYHSKHFSVRIHFVNVGYKILSCDWKLRQQQLSIKYWYLSAKIHGVTHKSVSLKITNSIIVIFSVLLLHHSIFYCLTQITFEISSAL